MTTGSNSCLRLDPLGAVHGQRPAANRAVEAARLAWEEELRRRCTALQAALSCDLAGAETTSDADARRPSGSDPAEAAKLTASDRVATGLLSHGRGPGCRTARLAPWDVLYTCLVANSNTTKAAVRPAPPSPWTALPFRIAAPTLRDLRICWRAMLPQRMRGPTPLPRERWVAFGSAGFTPAPSCIADVDTVLERGRADESRQVLTQGAHPSHRAALWAQALGLPPRRARAAASRKSAERDADALLFEELCRQVEARPLLVDYCVETDLRDTCNSSEFFVFSEVVRSTLLALSRDPSVPGECPEVPHPLLLAHPWHPPTQPGETPPRAGLFVYPPSGAMPSRALAQMAALVAYLTVDRVAHFHLFRALHCRLLWATRTISARPWPAPALPGLCALFEACLRDLDPELTWHLHSISAPPLKLVFPWLLSGFAGVLEAGQVLELWDRCVACESMAPASLLAAGVLWFKRSVLLSTRTPLEAQQALQDLKHLKTAPILLGALCGGV
ncbi:unnamed protein product [Pedinophyceae sp. YPF-701]|nr:unnamed protein product [Pedinophyceae sp. YPF-701]